MAGVPVVGLTGDSRAVRRGPHPSHLTHPSGVLIRVRHQAITLLTGQVSNPNSGRNGLSLVAAKKLTDPASINPSP